MSGPHIYNWQNIYEEMLNKNACFISNNISEMENTILDLFKNDYKMINMKKRSEKFAQNEFFDSKKLINTINNLTGVISC